MGKWIVAGALTLGMVVAAAAAGAKVYVATVQVTSSDNPDFTPFSFEQTWRTGPFTSGTPSTTHVNEGDEYDGSPAYDVTTLAGGGFARPDIEGYTAQLAVDLGMGDLYADASTELYQVYNTRTDYPDSGTFTARGQASLKYAKYIDTDLGGGMFRSQALAFVLYRNYGPPLSVDTLTEADFDGRMLAGPGDFTMRAWDFTFCSSGPCAASTGGAYNYYGSYTIASAPEPATWALMLGGFGLAGAGLRARRRSAAA